MLGDVLRITAWCREKTYAPLQHANACTASDATAPEQEERKPNRAFFDFVGRVEAISYPHVLVRFLAPSHAGSSLVQLDCRDFECEAMHPEFFKQIQHAMQASVCKCPRCNPGLFARIVAVFRPRRGL